MLVQYLKNSTGENTGVYIPIADWDIIKNLLKELNFEIIEHISKEDILSDLRDAFQEIKEHQTGKTRMQMAKDFLNEL